MAIFAQPQRTGFPLTLPLGKLGGKEAWLKISQVRVLSTQRLRRKLGKRRLEGQIFPSCIFSLDIWRLTP
jgi:ferredoxin-fold anticodon binding domain-containing protein